MKYLNQNIIAFFIWVISVLNPVFTQSQNEVYCNNRFNFCMQYPTEIFTQKILPENNDGIELHSADGTLVVKVSGVHNALESTIQEEFELFEQYLKNVGQGFVIISSKIEPEQFIAYAVSGKEVIYQKTVLTGPYLIYLTISSKRTTQEQSKKAIEEIEKELTFLQQP